MIKITADWIYPINSDPLQNHVLIYEDNGKIMDVEPIHAHDPNTIKMYNGALIPGFVNAHCHLELSHMKGLANTGTGLVDFISSVVKNRDAKIELILEQIHLQDMAMWDTGIQAVGDISNSAHTAITKASSKIRYHTFIEMFDFLNPNFTESSYAEYFKSFEAMILKPKDKISLAPHAPYTVSPGLFNKINMFNNDLDATVSIHNQETAGENDLFISKSGDLIDFYKSFDISLDHFKPINKRSIQYALPLMDKNKKTLLIHNTTCIEEDIQFAKEWSDLITWVSCPNANLYIENRLPDYTLFMHRDQNIALGTDSLTSNWQLSILEEIKTIKKYKSFINDEEILKWATINGAVALGFADELGSLEKGKSPGILLIDSFDDKGIKFNKDTAVRRIK